MWYLLKPISQLLLSFTAQLLTVFNLPFIATQIWQLDGGLQNDLQIFRVVVYCGPIYIFIKPSTCHDYNLKSAKYQNIKIHTYPQTTFRKTIFYSIQIERQINMCTHVCMYTMRLARTPNANPRLPPIWRTFHYRASKKAVIVHCFLRKSQQFYLANNTTHVMSV